ncbi:RagB/SusD family nutrient uptake outer membrane protein [Flavobacterium undicola]|uniref:RagB/SusD family nutrient uptake outer membrane protein n=1 Tax=Flavobacterium undicola TaxID=1932779 RepID=UPI001377F1F8|nr:RagB/SusD family nutrient uptake outer membrane protein [Flavobacterium undicola]MBA0885100.1 RagB/SusD family nutrient uptake outer membrane protein [Flavobacterium undicola]
MKYINYKLIVVLLTAGMLSTACDSYLEEENKSSKTIDIALIDPNTFDQFVASVYERARETTTHYAPDMYYSFEDLGTDIVTRGSTISGVSDLNDYVELNPLNGVAFQYWKNQYSIIAAANVAIDNADLIQGVDAAVKTAGVGEAKFFRAMSYFNLVENYGGVPLVLNQLKPSDATKTDYTRATEVAVYTQIIKDLEDALTGVNETPTVYGRVSKDAVRHLLSKVLLTKGYKTFGVPADFTTAATLAETVISHHALVDTFASLTSISNQRNSEVFFSYLFGSSTTSRGWGNSRHQMYKFPYYDYPGMTRGNLYQKGLDPLPTPFFFTLFDDNDQRADATFRREILADKAYASTVGGLPVTVPAGSRAIYFPKVAWTPAQIAAVPYKVINPDKYFVVDGVTNAHTPMFKKFDEPGVPFKQPNELSEGTRDMVIMRSGEAYLIAAEAYLKSANPTTAAARLTTLRARAGLITAVTAGQVTLDFILDERARELIGEVNRWMDLKRTGKLIERTLLYNPHAAMNNALKAKHLLRPIPQYEIDNTYKSIVQNPDY